MPSILQVLSTGPPLQFNCGATATVRNAGPSTVYYRDELPVTAAVNDASIASGATVALTGQQYFAVAAAGRAQLLIVERSPATSTAARDGTLATSKHSGLTLAGFSKVYLAEMEKTLYAIGSADESAGDLAGILRYDPDTDAWTQLGATPGIDYNGLFGWGHRAFLGDIYSGDRHAGALYKHAFNEAGVYTGTSQVATVGDEDVYCGPVFAGKLWLGTFTGSTNPAIYTWDGTTATLVKAFTTFPANLGGNTNSVIAMAVWRGYLWVGVAGSFGVPQTYELWKVAPDGTATLAYTDSSTGFHMCVHKGELVFVPVGADAATLAVYALRGSTLQRVSPFLSALGGTFNGTPASVGVLSVGDELFIGLSHGYYGVFYRAGEYRWVPGAGVTFAAGEWNRTANDPNALVDARVVGDSLWLTGNQAVRVSKLALGTTRHFEAASDMQQELGGASPADASGGTSVGYKLRAGAYYSNEMTATPSVRALTLNQLNYVPFLIPATTTLVRIAVSVEVAAGSASVRLGIYADHASGGRPGSRLLDAGTVSAATTGIKEITISQTLDPGVYWLACVTQGAACSITGQNAVPSTAIGGGTASTVKDGQTGSYWDTATVSGALPASANLGGVDPLRPQVIVRAA